MAEVKIRKATIEDFDEIRKLNQFLFIKEQKEFDNLYNINWPFEEKGEAYFKKELTEPNRIIFVAEIDDKIIGYLAASSENDSKFQNNAKIAELDNMFILKDFRGQGIGTKLVGQFLEWCKEIQAGRVVVIASAGNQEGIDFYKKQGFKDFHVDLKIDLEKE